MIAMKKEKKTCRQYWAFINTKRIKDKNIYYRRRISEAKINYGNVETILSVVLYVYFMVTKNKP